MNSEKSPYIKPFLKWAGGKRQLLPEIHKYLPKDIEQYKYYEPFLGAGAVFFSIQPQTAVIGDINSQLIFTYIAIRDNIDELIQLLNYHKQNHTEDYYYYLREKDREVEAFSTISNTEKAARLIFLNKTCYSGLYRVNSKGFFNVPYGRYKNPSVYEEESLLAINKYLNENDITIINSDYSDIIKSTDEKSFVYFDPPYYSAENTNFTEYQVSKFNTQEQIRLNELFLDLTNRGVKCILSNSDTNFIREIYSDPRYNIVEVSARRAINSKPSGRGNINELLICNWK